MNVLVLPSWYPHEPCFPLEGIYVRDQALALGALRPDARVGLALWGQGRNMLSLAHGRRSPRCIARALTERGVREETLAPNVAAWTVPALLFPERVAAGGREGVLRSAREAARRMTARFGRPDLLHAHVAYPGGWAAMHLARELGVPYVVTEHMGPFPLPLYRRADGALADFIRAPLAEADARIAVGRALADDIAAHGIERPDVVPNVVDERLYDATRTGDPDTFTFYTVCQMVRSKGVLDLLEAAARMLPWLAPEERARVRFRLAGLGPDLARFQAAAARLGLAERVTWIEEYLSRERSREEFARCDAFVLPSHHESFGIVFVEAMACGKPSIATRCGGPEDILTEETGVLVDVGDIDGLAHALVAMVRGAARYDRAALRAAFERRYARAAVVDALAAVYAKARARHAARAGAAR